MSSEESHSGTASRSPRDLLTILIHNSWQYLALPVVLTFLQQTTIEGPLELNWQSRFDMNLPLNDRFDHVVSDGVRVFGAGTTFQGGERALVAQLDFLSGGPLWSTVVPGSSEYSYTVRGARLCNDVITIAATSSPLEGFGSRGFLAALNADSGNVLWSIDYGEKSTPLLTKYSAINLIEKSVDGNVVYVVEETWENEIQPFEFNELPDWLHAVDSASGSTLWSRRLDNIGFPRSITLSNEGNRIALAGRRTDRSARYTATAGVFSADTGSDIWTSNLAVSNTLLTMATDIAFSADGTSLVVIGITPGSQIFQLDADDGSTNWESPTGVSTPLKVILDGSGRAIIAGEGSDSPQLEGFNLQSGQSIWRELESDFAGIHEIVAIPGTTRFLVSGLDTSYQDFPVQMRNSATGSVGWEVLGGKGQGSSPWATAIVVDALHDSFLAAGAQYQPELFGRASVESRTLSNGQQLASAAMDLETSGHQRGVLAALSPDGSVAYSAGTRLKEIDSATNAPRTTWVAAHAVADGTLLWSEGMIDTGNSQLLLQALSVGPCNERLYIGGHRNYFSRYLDAIDATNGAKLWEREFAVGKSGVLLGHMDILPSNSGDVVFFIVGLNPEMRIEACDAASGATLWSRPLDGWRVGAPSILMISPNDELLYAIGSKSLVGDRDVVGICCDAATGETVWSSTYDLSDGVAPWVYDTAGDALLSKNGASIYVVGSTNELAIEDETSANWIRIDAATGKSVWNVVNPLLDSKHIELFELALAPDNSTLFGIGNSRRVSVNETVVWAGAVDASSGQPVWTLEGDLLMGDTRLAGALSTTPDGSAVLITSGIVSNDGLTTDAYLIGLDAATGQTLYSATTTPDDTSVEEYDRSRAALIDSTGLNALVASEVAFNSIESDLVWQSYELPTLTALPSHVSVATGGVQAFSMSGGFAAAGEVVLLLGSLNGTNPGIDLDSGLNLPLNYDTYMQYTLVHPNQAPLSGSLNMFDEAGSANATLTIPAGTYASLAGRTANHAWVSIGATGVTRVSNPVRLELVP